MPNYNDCHTPPKDSSATATASTQKARGYILATAHHQAIHLVDLAEETYQQTSADKTRADKIHIRDPAHCGIIDRGRQPTSIGKKEKQTRSLQKSESRYVEEKKTPRKRRL